MRAAGVPVADAVVVVNGRETRTDATGVAAATLPPGAVLVVVARERFAPASVELTLAADERRTVAIDLVPQEAMEEEVTVAATRSGKRIEDEPIRVETLEREEIEEKLLMTPGDIVMMLNEMGGMRVQATSPSLGAASVRIQGQRGRYTRVLSDGLPLFGQQVGSLGLLQIPPMDLGRVEVIKGVASSLYGAGAMAGVVNMVSRRPGDKREGDVLANVSQRGATDGVLWYASPLSPGWGAALLAGAHGQALNDVDGDGWADLAHYARGVVRPRIFWDNKAGGSAFATLGVTIEDRHGGTVDGAVVPDGQPYEESLQTRRLDGGGAGQWLVRGASLVAVRASFAAQRQEHRFGEILERDRHDTAFAEVSVRRAIGRHTWVAGAAFERDAFDPRDVPRFAYTFNVPGAFVQDDVDVAPWLAISASARVDWHSEYGTFASPRLSALVKGGGWTSRVSAGTGFFAATPLTEETEAAGLSRLEAPPQLEAERGRSLSADLTRTMGPLSATITSFASRVRDPIRVERSPAFFIFNSSAETTNDGVDVLATWRRSPMSVTGTYTYVRSREGGAREPIESPLTPRHSAGLVGMWERESAGRIGFELYYTGTQRLEVNPYRDYSRPYVILGALVERRVGRARLFVNGENLTGVRQSRWDPLLRPARGADGRWTVDAWAPLEGVNVNGGVRLKF